tara:strand:- start:352 stop:585 length:234 start_codon:yes stop_codon:yes gene_type:complete
MVSDNIARAKTDSKFAKIFLFPGKVIQWFNYMFVGGLRGYGAVRQQTRLARSPIMTWVYSIGFWIFVIFMLFSGLAA